MTGYIHDRLIYYRRHSIYNAYRRASTSLSFSLRREMELLASSLSLYRVSNEKARLSLSPVHIGLYSAVDKKLTALDKVAASAGVRAYNMRER